MVTFCSCTSDEKVADRVIGEIMTDVRMELMRWETGANFMSRKVSE